MAGIAVIMYLLAMTAHADIMVLKQPSVELESMELI